MNAPKRAARGVGGPVGQAPRNTATTMKSSETQARHIKNAHNDPKACSFKRVRNAVNG